MSAAIFGTPLQLAWRTLVRRPRRLLLFAAGVTVAAATLLDMVMLAEGLQRSLRDLLEETGYQVRVTPKGLLPFETEATIPDVEPLIRELSADPRIEAIAPIWGQTVYVGPAVNGRVVTRSAFAVGIPDSTAPTLRLRRGRTIRGPGEVVLSTGLAREFGTEPGDTVVLGLRPDPTLGALLRERSLRVTGIAEFPFAAESAASVAISIESLAELAGRQTLPASLLLIRTFRDREAYDVAGDFRRRVAGADVYAIPEIIEAAGDRLTYFQRLSGVLGTVSVGVAFLLIATLLTLSVNDRWGEIATLRAIGVTRPRMLAQIAWQGLMLSGLGALGGLGLGLLVAEYLDTILRDFPGLPASVSFFVLEPRDAVYTATLVIATGLAAGLYPAWRAASVNVAGALREEIR